MTFAKYFCLPWQQNAAGKVRLPRPRAADYFKEQQNVQNAMRWNPQPDVTYWDFCHRFCNSKDFFLFCGRTHNARNTTQKIGHVNCEFFFLQCMGTAGNMCLVCKVRWYIAQPYPLKSSSFFLCDERQKLRVWGCKQPPKIQVHMQECTQAQCSLDNTKGGCESQASERDVRLVSPGARFHNLICFKPCATVMDDFMKPGPAWRETCSTCPSEKAIMAEIIFTLCGHAQHKPRLSHLLPLSPLVYRRCWLS